ncbi:plasmid replication protein RepC [Kiloniella laminariae]|uniref:Plasmid replication protein RepC n=1 Tax=Kiloniella laminariae TaxID=454162 RepID=A0ABT4LPQ0_9PROT|nr:plasmid replication protein RepC [Kiloniella laminariae]MCZ4283115.1 plasmid replication protein RepC [Kiloniella laminariae]
MMNLGSRPFTAKGNNYSALQSWTTLPEEVDRFRLLHLLDNVGISYGLKPQHIRYLTHLIKFTSDKDWHLDAYHPPVAWQSVFGLAKEFGVDQRTIRRWENDLHDRGLIDWSDSGNHKRYGKRDGRGFIQYAYGVDLSPLAKLYEDLENHLANQKAETVQFDILKRKLSAQKRRVRVKFCAAELSLDEIQELPPIRPTSRIEDLQAQIDFLTSLELEVDQYFKAQEQQSSCSKAVNMSATDDINVRHYYTTTKPYSSKEDTCNQDVDKRSAEAAHPRGNLSACADTANCFPKKHVEKSEASKTNNQTVVDNTSTGIEHLNVKLLLNAASPEFREHIPLHDRALLPADLVTAAELMCHSLGINRSAWTEACSIMGRFSAAVCVLIADSNQHNPVNPVLNPGGFFRGMISKARQGELQLHRSVFGILQRDNFNS